MSTLAHCEKKWDWRYNKRIEPVREEQQFTRGQWIHFFFAATNLLHGYNKQTLTLTDSLEAPNEKAAPANEEVAEWAIDVMEEEWERWDELTKLDWQKRYKLDMPSLCVQIVTHWLYEHDWWNDVSILGAEVPLKRGQWAGKADVIYRHNSKTQMGDYKTFQNAIPNKDYRLLDAQQQRYMWMAEELNVFAIRGSIEQSTLFYASTKIPSHPKLNQNGSISKAAWTGTSHSYVSWCDDMEIEPDESILLHLSVDNSHFQDHVVPKRNRAMRFIMAQDMGTYSRMLEIENGARPIMNVNDRCSWCAYNDLCVVEVNGGFLDGSMLEPKYKKV